MEELRNEEMNQEVDNELETLMEMETPKEVTDEVDDSSSTTKIIAGGIAVIGLAAYGMYELGKNIVMPGAKKGINWIKDHVGKKKDGEVIEAESEFVFPDDDDDFEEEAK